MKPIIFKPELASKIAAGLKTQTRRPIAEPDTYGCLTGDCPHEFQTECAEFLRTACPLGKPGDQLWVRENWQCPEYEHLRIADIPHDAHVVYHANYFGPLETNDGAYRRWRPSIHMPRWAARLILTIKDVRVEKLKSITDADAVAEGFANRSAFLRAWQRIYKPDALFEHLENCWVWVDEFDVH